MAASVSGFTHKSVTGLSKARLLLASSIYGRRAYNTMSDMGKTKYRSPNYPRLAIDLALDKTKIVYGSHHKHAESSELIAKALGYTSASTGTSKAVIATLKYYGLLEPAGNGLRVSEDGVRVFELPQGDPERTRALSRMISAPQIFADLQKRFGIHLPPNLRHVLITQGYAPRAADEIIRLYRGNLEFLTGQTSGTLAEELLAPDNLLGNDAPELNQTTESDRSRGVSDNMTERVLQFQISEASDARIHFRGRPNRNAIKKLIALLNLSEDTFPVT